MSVSGPAPHLGQSSSVTPPRARMRERVQTPPVRTARSRPHFWTDLRRKEARCLHAAVKSTPSSAPLPFL
eukprot:5996223-Pyramimonas_sp.AAC.1